MFRYFSSQQGLSSTEEIYNVVTDEDHSMATASIDIPQLQRRCSDESTAFSLSQAAKATQQYQTSPHAVLRTRKGLNAIRATFEYNRTAAAATADTSRDELETRRETPFFRQFSSSLSDIMSKFTCANSLEDGEPDVILKDEDFYWPSSAQSTNMYDAGYDEDIIHVPQSSTFNHGHFFYPILR
jgi:hypothetical protein